MNDLFCVFEFIRAYTDNMLILTKAYWTYHVHKLELTLNKLKVKGHKFNIEESFFGQIKMEYLGFWVTRNGIKSINKKIDGAIYFPKRSTKVYRCNKLLPQYLDKLVTDVIVFN